MTDGPEYVTVIASRGTKGIKEFVRTYRTAFPDLRFTFDDIITSGGQVIARFTARGTHTGPLLGIEPTGKKMQVSGIGIADITDRVNTKSVSQINVFDMLQQLGIAPPTEQLTGHQPR